MPTRHLGGFFRLGNRANEGHGEMTVCIWLPDGRVAFMFARPEVTTNDAFDAAGMRFAVVEPFKELRVSYTGPVVLLTDPLQMADPRAAFTTNPHLSCTVELTYHGRSDMFGGEPDTPAEHPGEEFAHGHYEQLVEATGSLLVGDEHLEIHGYGLRDHSWGPRYWQAPWYYRWLTANFGRLRFHGLTDRSPRLGGIPDRISSGTPALCTSATTFASVRLGNRRELPPKHPGRTDVERSHLECPRQRAQPGAVAQPKTRSRRQATVHQDLGGTDRVDSRRRSHGVRSFGVPRPDRRRRAGRARRMISRTTSW